MSDQTPEQMLDALGVPFPDHALEQRPGGSGKMLTYVATETVIRFLNTTVKVWDFEITSHTIIGDVLVVFGKLTIPGLGTRSGTGVQKLQGGEDTIKGAASDCLKKCATLFGVALDLYGPDLLAGELPNEPKLPARTRTTSVNTIRDDGDDPFPGGGGVTNKQIRAINAIGRALNLSIETTRTMHGAASATDLDQTEAEEFLFQLREMEARAKSATQAPMMPAGPDRYTTT